MMFTLHVDNKELYSVFQPIYSFSNQACIGAEVLVRGKDVSNSTPISVEECLSPAITMSQSEFTQSLTRTHLKNWKGKSSKKDWIFLNVDFQYLDSVDDLCISDLLNDLGINGHELVVEVVESEIQDDVLFQNIIQNIRKSGCLIALDDFGAGHSNVDRIWKAQPDIVKLDRQVLLEATKSIRSQSVLRNLTRLIQQSGSIALLEGVETREQALLAMDVGVDLVQGFYFAKPERDFAYSAGENLVSEVTHAYTEYQKERKFVEKIERSGYEPLFESLYGLNSAFHLEEEMLSVSQLSFVKRFYILDLNGFQISEEYELEEHEHSMKSAGVLKKGKGLCWKNRRYFAKAMQNQNQVYISKPYRSLIDIQLCLTLSKMITLTDGTQFIVCFDVSYHDKSTLSVQISI